MTQRSFDMILRTLAVGLLLVAGTTSARAAGRVDVILDRAAVTELLAAAMPRNVEVELIGAGAATLELGPPRSVAFIDGGVELEVTARLPALKLGSVLDLRFVPRVEPRLGTVELAAERARIRALRADVARFLPAFALPRRLDASVDVNADRQVELIWYVQGVRVSDEGLIVELGLVAR